MSESEQENENFCFFGTPLDPYEEDVIPKKRPIFLEEQIATDPQGRRRFHGAFTGGFSAGFFNTVGSLEGWTPSEFKSSRSEKSKGFTQKPQDFMDDEDLGEDGIAHQRIAVTDDFNSSKKRKKQVFFDGPIPGEPVLHNILATSNETIGYMLLKNLKLRDRRKQKDESAKENKYGCEMPDLEENVNLVSESSQYEIPEIYNEFLANPKDNTFGLGYSGLDKSHFNLFSTDNKSKLVVTDKNNKKLSITGQAFGVGAFEEDDDDIYMKEDMSKYDFELVSEKVKVSPKKDTESLVFGLFVRSKETPLLKNSVSYPPPKIPHSFTGKYKVRRSRFEPVPQNEPVSQEEQPRSSTRINPMIRARYLGEEPPKEFTASGSSGTIVSKKEIPTEDQSDSALFPPGPSASSSPVTSTYLSDRFISSSKEEDITNILQSVESMDILHGTEQMREAVRMKMFGPLTRTTSDWVPCALLCKRFNVPEPLIDRPEKSRSRTKNIIFEYQKHVEEVSLQPGLMKKECDVTSIPEGHIAEENIGDNKDETIQPNKNISEETTEVKNESVDSAPKIITDVDRLHLEEKQDLFKAIFLTSDSEEDEEIKEENVAEKSNDESRKEELKSMVLSDQLIPKIKPMKEGILSGINFHKFVKPIVKTEEIINDKPDDGAQEQNTNDVHCYGPKIPDKLSTKIKPNVSAISSESDVEWVEKDSDSKQKKKQKKEKKHKKGKHKRHKHEKKNRHKD